MAFEFAGLAYRNPTWVGKNARHAWATAKSMRDYRKRCPCCEFCGRKARVQVHHVFPVSVAPHLAADAGNMVTLCAKRCHITVGHNGNYRSRYVENVKEICAEAAVIRTKGSDHEADSGTE